MALARCMESQIHSSGELLSEAAHAALQTLDERLHESLAEGTIRLLSIHEWLLSQPEDWVWQNRQKLEELERSGTARPFLSREEAESALAAATRRIAVISHTRVDSMVRLLGNDSRRQIPDLTTDLAPQRDVYRSWADSSHDDVERTSLMLAIVATMYGLDVCDVSHHRCTSVGFGWHRCDTSGIPRCTGPSESPCRGPGSRVGSDEKKDGTSSRTGTRLVFTNILARPIRSVRGGLR